MTIVMIMMELCSDEGAGGDDSNFRMVMMMEMQSWS